MAPTKLPKHVYIITDNADLDCKMVISNPKTGKGIVHVSPGSGGPNSATTAAVMNICVNNNVHRPIAILATRPSVGFPIDEKKSWFSKQEQISFSYHAPCEPFKKETKFEWKIKGNRYILVNEKLGHIFASYTPKGMTGGELRTFIPLEDINYCTEINYRDEHLYEKRLTPEACVGEVMRLMIQTIVPIVNDEIIRSAEEILKAEKKAGKYTKWLRFWEIKF